MRLLAASDKSISPQQILQMATINGACALGMAGQVGEISENTSADLITIPFDGKITDAFDAVLTHTGNVSASMIDGRWVIPPK
jgi:cytosine/adenosine deaminase-related metal-dependent hydrolase